VVQVGGEALFEMGMINEEPPNILDILPSAFGSLDKPKST
jgi:hypothetical protein